MKKQYLSVSLFLTLAVVAVATPVLAQDIRANVSGGATGTPIRANVRANVEAKKASTTERKASSTERRVEMQKNLAQRKAEHTARVLIATIERLEKIIVRLESRIAKVKALGGVTTETESFVAEAKNHLSLAKLSITTFSSIELSGNKARDNFERVRAVAAEVKGHIREAHTSLMKAIRSLKPGQRTATSTSDSQEE